MQTNTKNHQSETYLPDIYLDTCPRSTLRFRKKNLELPWKWLEEFRRESAGLEPGSKPYFTGMWPKMDELFRINAWRFPNKLCFSCYDPKEEHYTYKEVLDRLETLASYLKGLGVQKGDRLAVWGKNSPQWAMAWLAVLFAGGIVVPLDSTLELKDALKLLNASGSRILFTDQDKILECEKLGSTEIPQKLISLEKGSAASPWIMELTADAKEELKVPSSPAETDSPDLAAILYTSGTTGNPKGVMLSHENLVADAFLSQYLLPIYSSDVFYALLPIHHSYTMLAVFVETLAVGAELIFGKRMAVKQILSDLKQGKVSMFLGVPMLFNKLLNGIMKGIRQKGLLVYGLIQFLMQLSRLFSFVSGKNQGKLFFKSVLKQASLENIRICISGGGPLAASTFRAFNQLGIDFVQGYGLTETSPIITLNPVWHYKTSSVGTLVPGVEMRIENPDENGKGEIVAKGPMIMQGYYKNPQASEAVLEADGWLHTGDVGYMDSEGYVYLTGRAKNLIVTEGGKNVYPEELENLFTQEEIDQILIRGYISNEKRRTESIEALIYPNINSFSDEAGNCDWAKAEETLLNFVKEVNKDLPAHERISKTTILREAMEMTSTRKIRRHQVSK